MPPRRRTTRQAADTSSGEIFQLEIFGEEEAGRREPPVRYDWTPHPGRHVNLGKALMRKVWDAESGYDEKDRDILGYFISYAPEGAGPLRETFKQIAAKLGVSENKVSKAVANLHRGGLLLESVADRVGRVKFYRLNPRAGYDGPAVRQVEAVKDARFPVVPAPQAPARPRRARTRKEAS
ncbi:transcriptional regulator [Streptomyces albidoflavus]|uniref:helix-turn-helix domain-containing protein n=1 Tax=Streptomyces albidoflavus TaxID=1886 RepID=UPI00101E6060|nr:helix-turn-helix domain-containing protein [Streptomyces albidoflavus]RZD62903.1 transcriptional regulator [Streptomyces albidoflavus]